MFERELLNDVPMGWKSHGKVNSVDADPMNGIPNCKPRIEPRDGFCIDCGKELPIKSGRGRKPVRCKDCASKSNSTRKSVQRQRLASTRHQVGSVPVRLVAFANYVKWFNRGLPKDQRIVWHDTDFGNVKSNVLPALGFTSEWYGVRNFMEHPEDHFWRPVFNRKLIESRFLGSDCREFISESEAMPKGTKPESVGQQVCDECGAPLSIELPSGRRVGAKIGTKVLACTKCGLVHAQGGVVSHASKGNPDWNGSN